MKKWQTGAEEIHSMDARTKAVSDFRTVGRWGARTVGSGLRTFAHWWLTEFERLFPPSFGRWLFGRAGLRLTIEPNTDYVTFELDRDGARLLVHQVASGTSSTDVAEQLLLAQGARLADVDLVLKIDGTQFYSRVFFVPREARRRLPQLVQEDLLRHTPFQLEKIVHHYSASDDGHRLRIEQFVLRRDVLEAAAGSVAIPINRIAYVSGTSEDGTEPAITIPLQEQTATRSSWVRPATVWLLLAGIALAATWGTGRYIQQQRTLEALAAEMTKAQREADRVRALVAAHRKRENERSVLHSRKLDNPSTLAIIDELSSLLPDHTWATELRISESTDRKERHVTLNGFSQAAASLVGLIEKSETLTSATLIAPVAFDALEGKERFALRALARSRTARSARGGP